MATISYREDRECWEVRWAEPVTTVLPDGSVNRDWKWRRKSCRTQTIAKQLARQVEDALALGHRYQESVSMQKVAVDFIAACQAHGNKDATTRHRASLLESWLRWWQDRPLSALNLPLLEAYSFSLPSKGRAAATRHRKILVVEQLWRWAWERRSEYPGISSPSRITGIGGIAPPAPVVASAAPTWAEADAMIDQLRIPWHRMAALLIRYCGLRASQVCGLEWRDLDLERGVLRVRAGVRGAKGGRARVVPLHPDMARELAAWAPPEARTGLLFPRRYKDKAGQPYDGDYRGDALVEPCRRAWTLSGVPTDRWGVSEEDGEEERAHGSPSHALRRCVRSELLRVGAEEAVVLHLVGHASGHTAAAYVPESSPEQSPWWPRLLAAVRLIPSHRTKF